MKSETWEKSFGFGKKIGSDTDTESGPSFWFPIPKPGFGRTLTDSTQEIIIVQEC